MPHRSAGSVLSPESPPHPFAAVAIKMKTQRWPILTAWRLLLGIHPQVLLGELRSGNTHLLALLLVQGLQNLGHTRSSGQGGGVGGTHVELAALTKPLRALGITSGPGQCPCSLDGPELHVPGSCDRGFLDLSGGLGLSIKRSSSSRPSCLFHPLALIASLDLNYPRHSQNANKGLSPSFVLS